LNLKSIFILFFTLTICLIPLNNIYAGQEFTIQETDTGDLQLVGFFDLRDRESIIQITNTDSASQTIHIQLFNAGNLCNENDFFDTYTPNDTHVYNIRDIQTNDGNSSGIILPKNAYGIFVATYVNDISGNNTISTTMIGNLRIEANNGYEYRTNLNGIGEQNAVSINNVFTFNYNTANGVILSDVIGFNLENVSEFFPPDNAKVFAADILNIWTSFDIDIFDLNEVPFSCRNVIFACTDQENPLLGALIETSGDASVASFDYGINEAIPNSKNAPLLCPNNIITEGFVRLSFLNSGLDETVTFMLFVGLNNGNGRGSLDSLWYDENIFTFPQG